eukprot:CAMPEP_0177768972 /NCGR_PEP_ID=MMETSP0491_2-20121128/10036_1 /TAXON_ID=63592 /ORGANISM="Tetraselmis chuii, Strain PLY429" /LENGTH=336 /DNA_ID=CAMNT_0019285875 /DNA_START=99 /DNA_END=1109 /DNA_ORIENTATION=-
MEATSITATLAARPILAAAAAPAARAQVLPRARLLTRPASLGKSSLRQRAMSCERRVVVAAAEAGEEVAVETSEEPKPETRPAGRGRRVQREVTVPFESIEVGKTYKGTVKTTAPFGAFVDIGSSTDGLVHISQLSNAFVSAVEDVVQVGKEVEVRVIAVDAAKGKFGLSMKAEQAEGEAGGESPSGGRVPGRGQVRQARRSGGKEKREAVELPFSKGDTIKGTVARITAFGAFVTVTDGVEGLLHTSELMRPDGKGDARVSDILKEGEEVEVTVLDIKSGKVSLTNITEEYRAREKIMVKQGVGSVADASTSLEYALKKAGLTPDMFGGKAATEV